MRNKEKADITAMFAKFFKPKKNQWIPDMKQRCHRHIHTHATTVKPYLGIGSSSTIKNS